jgi:hypothetical protein
VTDAATGERAHRGADVTPGFTVELVAEHGPGDGADRSPDLGPLVRVVGRGAAGQEQGEAARGQYQ